MKLFIASSLDGYIATPAGGLDWLLHDGDYGMTEFHRSVDTVLIGRKTHEAMVRAGQPSYDGLMNYVLSRSNYSAEGNVQLVSDELGVFMRRLQKEPGKDIWLLGGGELVDSFLREGLVDEVILAIHPVLLGEGVPLFPGANERLALELVSARSYDSGLVSLHYRRSA